MPETKTITFDPSQDSVAPHRIKWDATTLEVWDGLSSVSDRMTTSISKEFTLYLPVINAGSGEKRIPNVSALAAAFRYTITESSLTFYTNNVGGNPEVVPTEVSTPTVNYPGVLYVPYRVLDLPREVTFTDLVADASKLLLDAPATTASGSQASSEFTTTSAESATAVSTTESTNATSSSSPVVVDNVLCAFHLLDGENIFTVPDDFSAGGFSLDLTNKTDSKGRIDCSPSPSPSLPPSSSPSSSPSPKSTPLGPAIGGSIGGLIVGILAGIAVGFCLLARRRPRVSMKNARGKTADHEVLDSRDDTIGNEMHFLAGPNPVTGWQKHLPQEKDDGTISGSMKDIFHRIEIHMDGFYKARPDKLMSAAVAALDRVSSDGLSRKLPTASNDIPILEAILARWIIRRISLRSSTRQSLLPIEYTKIPEQTTWHMESDEASRGQMNEPVKAFPQALSQWRVLTSFLRPSPENDHAFKKELEDKISRGVEALTEAFSPWEMRGASNTARNNGLRQIIQQSHEAGIVLFAQPSTFAFDWSGKDGSVTIFPALVKRLDELAMPIDPVQVLIAAKSTSG